MRAVPILIVITGLIYLFGGILAIVSNGSYFAAFPVYQMMNGGNPAYVIPIQVISGAATQPGRILYALATYLDPNLSSTNPYPLMGGTVNNLTLTMYGLPMLLGIIALIVGYWLFRGKKTARPLAYSYLLLDIAGLIFFIIENGPSAVNLYNILYLGLSLLLYIVMFAFIRTKDSKKYFNTAPA